MASQPTVSIKSSVQFHFDCSTCGNFSHFLVDPKRLKDGQIRAGGTCDVCENAVIGFSEESKDHSKSDSYVRAIVRFVESVEVSDDPRHYHTGPDYDLYEITVEIGPERAFLTWFERSEYDLCRVGDTSQFLDLGSPSAPMDGEIIDFTFEEFFPRWLDASVQLAQAEILRMSRDAITRMALA
ncbi:conserved hypothetical protein [Pseudomonas veronii]|uniref:hypothetical protein n=1 Tax=Pseudomonas veronii TaxID=76761 RepID=UPI001778EED8|nr:hypothetical protein [Pseudomonas veronii]CAD0264243.1 conserved hypothetical protein [Pseudomonas veronii]